MPRSLPLLALCAFLAPAFAPAHAEEGWRKLDSPTLAQDRGPSADTDRAARRREFQEMTPEERQAARARMRERMENLTPEQKEKLRERGQHKMDERLARLSESDRAAILPVIAHIKSLPEGERRAYIESLPDDQRAILRQLRPHRRGGGQGDGDAGAVQIQ